MNKYKEALKNIVEASCPEHNFCEECYMKHGCTKQAKGWTDTLYELVEKEEPKTPTDIPRGHVPKNGNCPNCGSFVLQTCDSARCVVCGQKLKWDDDE